MTMPDLLAAFASESLFDASGKFLKHLGVKTSAETEDPIPFLELYEDAAKEASAEVPKPILKLFKRVEKTYFVGTVTDDTLSGNQASVDFKGASAQPKYEGMFVFAVQMKDGETLTRGEAAILTRGINRVVRQQPATVLILEKAHTETRRHGEGESELRDSVAPCEIFLSVATCERTTYKQTWRPGEKLGKVSILKGVNCQKPHRGHIDVLESMNVADCKSFDELYAQWKDVFSAKLLTKQFYREIQNWYFWALKKDLHVSYPNALDDDTDDDKFNKENLIRLITRLVFTWFMKAKGLVNEDLFKTEFLAKALKHFDPEGAMDDPNAKDADKHCTFYRAILQNLFFATFNQEIKDRGFVEKKEYEDKKHFHIKNFYRNADLFTESNKEAIIKYFNGSPFVNGGLFECLDNIVQNGKEYCWDGFSNKVKEHGHLNSALIPDQLFFGAERMVDLSEFFENDRSSRAVKVRGIVKILNDYVFTIEENTPLDEDVALDPELLGKVFENLLGCYNPETQQMARNATGSFYTPREIVNYMVHVSLAAYLKRTCPKIDAKEIDQLVEGTGELDTMPSVKAGALDILKALFKAKILDPACGSGAFPMGTMAAMVEILRTVDPDNKHWFKIVLEESLKEAESVADVGNAKERAELKAQIEYDFQKRVDFPDYARKLYVIEHCIFGSDIQPIAVQISRLRFFITLLCEQAKTDDPDKNYGITPLPNLENNFVAANSLLSIDLKDMRELLGQKKIVSLVKQLRAKRHQLFLPKTSDKKKRLQKEDEILRDQIASAAEGLYDENVAEKLKLLEAEIVRADADLKKLTPADFKDVVRDIEETDLFGTKTVTRKTVIGKGNELKKRREAAASEVASLKNSSRKERLLADLKRLVAWNPFAFNVAESFLDPEWMFGVKDGFDIVIGNPPYIQLQANGGELAKMYEDKGFETFESTGDIYCLFYEKSFNSLHSKGFLCFITSNKWIRNDYGKSLRAFFAASGSVELLVDFSSVQVFDSAMVDTNIIVVTNEQGIEEYGVVVDPSFMGNIANKVEENKVVCKFRNNLPWLIVDDREQLIIRKIEEAGKSITALGMTINYGIKTGCNEVYLIDDCSRTRLINEDSSSDRVISPILKDDTVRAYTIVWDDRYIINFHNGYTTFAGASIKPCDPDEFPAIKNHIDRVAKELGSGVRTTRGGHKGANKGFYARTDRGVTAYNLRNCAYVEAFNLPKIIWKQTSSTQTFALDLLGHFMDVSGCFMWKRDLNIATLKYYLGILNSRLSHYWFLKNAVAFGSKGIRWIPAVVGRFVIADAGNDLREKILVIVDKIIAAKKQDPDADTSKLEAEIDSIVYKLYGLTDDEIKVVEKAVKK